MSPDAPLVSVIIPTYNRPEFLRRAVESVLEQTYENIEVVIVDDCPSNSAESAVDEFSDSRIKYIQHETNRGVCVARNTGIIEADGEYLCFLDDDDEWMEQKLELQMKLLKQRSDVGFVYTGTQRVGDSKEILSVTKPREDGDITKELLLGDFIPFSTILVERQVIQNAGMLDQNLTNWEDWEWCIRLSKHTKVGYVEHPLVLIHKGSHDKRSDNFQQKRDVGFEKFTDKVQPIAAEHGSWFERKFLAHDNYRLGYAALSNGYHSDAKTHLLLAIKLWPFAIQFYVYLSLALLGKQGYNRVRLAKRWLVDRLNG